MEQWSIGAMEYWSIGVLEYWSIGVLEAWSNGLLKRSGYVSARRFRVRMLVLQPVSFQTAVDSNSRLVSTYGVIQLCQKPIC
jgi:hypothetical protein